jgi:magnesium transporter
MARFLKSITKAKGAAPGSLIFMGDKTMEIPIIRLFQYNLGITSEKEYQIIEDALTDINPSQMNWLNIDGLHDTSIIQKIGKHFGISALILDNVLNTGQRSKFIDDKSSLTILTKAVYHDSDTNEIYVEQISFIICWNVLISFQEKPGDHFEPVRERIRNNIGLIRKLSSDYLLYSLLDSLVDNYLITIEQIGSKIEELDRRLDDPDKELSDELFHYKTEITYFRKAIHPLREVMTRLVRSDSEFIKKETHIYFQELNDLVDHSNDSIDIYFGMIGDQLNLYHTNLSNRANDVMKVLTIFASIFIPLTFIAGIYGTNFDFVPELHFRYSYFVMWGVMVIVAGSMLYYFKKNKWF